MTIYQFPDKKKKTGLGKKEASGKLVEKTKFTYDPKKDFRLQDFKRRLRDIWK